MRSIFRLAIRHGSEPVIEFGREHEAAGYAIAGDCITIFEGQRGVPVERVIYDLVDDVTYTHLHGVLYDNARDFVADTEWLRGDGWTEVKPTS